VLGNTGETVFYFYLTQLPPYITWKAGQAIVERFGPKVLPMEARGTERIDVRIYKLDPKDLRFWPFPSSPVSVNEQSSPLFPGEEDQARSIEQQIKLLGSPDFSDVVKLPVGEKSGASRFGLDIAPYLERISGSKQPGTYLVGYRPLDGTTNRSYVRLQVTDLSLSTVEEEHGILFLVTSLASGEAVSNATVIVEGTSPDTKGYVTFISGKTDARGRFYYPHRKAIRGSVKRIRIENGDDSLILDTALPPPNFMSNHWYGSSSPWLSWIAQDPVKRREEAVQKGYIFTDRPIYRPEEAVHISGFIRLRQQGEIKKDPEGSTRTVTITGPGYKTWTYEAELGDLGQFYLKFAEPDLPTGDYTLRLLDRKGTGVLDELTFKKEAYRVPTFEARITGPDLVRLDEQFKLLLTADYYSGGRVVGQEVSWDVTRYPYQVRPSSYGDFLFSSDERFTGRSPRQQIGYSSFSDITDKDGSSSISLNPALENESSPVRYIVEATVQGADRMTVTATYQVRALPPFLVGVKAPRIVRGSLEAKPQVLILGYDEKPLAGQPYTVRLYNRQWHSYLAESDFTTGQARYVSDVVDLKVYEEDFVSEAAPREHRLQVKEPGVYVIEVLSRDNLGRLQSVKTDFYVEGEAPVSWERTEANVFETVAEKSQYNPGEMVRLVIKSPYQEANALVVIEGPKGNEYNWLPVKNGQCIFEFRAVEDMTPMVPVHVLILRGRVKGTEELKGNKPDLGKPAAMASTTWVKVLPRANQAVLSLVHDDKTLPGKTLKLSLDLKDPDGNPLDGLVVLWLVDRAVLSLGEERFRDPLENFIDETRSALRFRETRNLVVGNLPVEENPGGGGSKSLMAREMGILDKATVRRNFQTVPYFNAAVRVVRGSAVVEVPMPDNLTEFAIRAVAVSGFSRFATAKSVVAVRLPVIVQSAMPRFVRPGDVFKAGAIGRVVEGSGGAGGVQIRTKGLTVEGGKELSESVELKLDTAHRFYYTFNVPQNLEEGSEAVVTMGVERRSDGALDAFEIPLPVRYSVRRVTDSTKVEIRKGDTSVSFPTPDLPYKAGTEKLTITAATDPAFLSIITGMNFLAEYRHGCTEQRVSRLYPAIALKEFLGRFDIESPVTVSQTAFAELTEYLSEAMTERGFYAFWPGSEGYVSLTAYVVEFLVQARNAGYTVPSELIYKPQEALKAALRSDYRGFIPGQSFRERVDALCALQATGIFDRAYAYDLLSDAQGADLYSQARLLELFYKEKRGNEASVKRLAEHLEAQVVFDLKDREKVFKGLKYTNTTWGGLIISSEARTLSHVIIALHYSGYKDLSYLVDDLVTRAGNTGWGSTTANVAALKALGTVLSAKNGKPISLDIRFGDGTGTVTLKDAPLVRRSFSNRLPASVSYGQGSDPASLLLSTSYVPSGSGADIPGVSQGYGVSTVLHLYRNGEEKGRFTPQARKTIEFSSGDIVEIESVLTVPEATTFAALTVPFACGFEPLNPQLATAPKEAKPAGINSRDPSYAIYGDDAVTWYFNELPAGTYRFFFRLRASFSGTFTQPGATAENLYDTRLWGRGEGTYIRIQDEQ